MDSMEGRLDLLTDKNSCLVLIDYQASMFKGVASGDKSAIKLAAVGAAKAASIWSPPWFSRPMVLPVLSVELLNTMIIMRDGAACKGHRVFSWKIVVAWACPAHGLKRRF